MKQLLIIAILLIGKCYGQYSTDGLTIATYPITTSTLQWNVNLSPNSDTRVLSKYDTTILYNGDSICQHTWATKGIYQGAFSGRNIGCAVAHGVTGCPDTWLNEKSICTKCLRHIQAKETRYIEIIKNPYDEALERLQKITGKK